ncbi:MAG: GspE/PulE family protein [Candidatus Eremiobacteraeota bacterium]|nr:GspE/PulE family protein [Candidatus Eremiobacteraeota bacterium]
MMKKIGSKPEYEFPPLILILMRREILSNAEAVSIRKKMEEGGLPLEKVLLEYLDREVILKAREEEFGKRFKAIDIVKNRQDFEKEATDFIPREYVKKLGAICLQKRENTIAIAMVNPVDDMTIHSIEDMTGCQIKARYLCLAQDLELFFTEEKPEEQTKEPEPADRIKGPRIFEDAGNEALMTFRPIVDAIFRKGLELSASDIHIEPSKTGMRVRYRIDGILQEDREIDVILDREGRTKQLLHAIVNIIKNRSGASGKDMRLDEREKPQDGRIYIPDRDLDLRISIIPSMHGESVVVRIHYREIGSFSLDRLGFEHKDLDRFAKVIESPYGIILVSGPTGSGKTTTLYSVMQIINNPQRKTLTIEDPIEYSIEGAVQAQTNAAKNFTFDEALRVFLRHDPDIIMVGEIRDEATASMAVEASLTGHLVLSSIHANDAVTTITRLKDLSVDPRLITSTCLATLAQRLVRQNCPQCSEHFTYSTRLYNAFEKYAITYDPADIRKGKGCPKCSNTGYSGRVGLFELLIMSYEIKELILQDASLFDVTQVAASQGMKSLIEAALLKVARGVTSEEEIWRVTLAQQSA